MSVSNYSLFDIYKCALDCLLCLAKRASISGATMVDWSVKIISGLENYTINTQSALFSGTVLVGKRKIQEKKWRTDLNSPLKK